MPSNQLYFVVLPLMSLRTGNTEQTLTLLPNRDFATEFYPDEVQAYLTMFQNRIKYLTGGHVTGYELRQEKTADGRVVVRVTQNVG
jgi:hypothetical protein